MKALITKLRNLISGSWLRKPITCERAVMFLPALYDKKLDAFDLNALNAHIESCADCAREKDKIEELKRSLVMIKDVAWPTGIAKELSGILRRSRKMYSRASSRRSYFVHRQLIYRRTSDLLFLVVLASMIVAMFSFDLIDRLSSTIKLNDSRQWSSTESTLPPNLDKDSVKQNKDTGKGGGGIEEYDINSPGEKPEPQLSITNNSYNKKDVSDVVTSSSSILEFIGAYTPSDVPTRQQMMIDNLAQQAQDKGQNGQVLKSSILNIIKGVRKPALPDYVEKAKFEKNNAWIIVLVTWPNADGDAQPSVAVFAVSAQTGNVLYTD